jgi:hypothetical protein
MAANIASDNDLSDYEYKLFEIIEPKQSKKKTKALLRGLNHSGTFCGNLR